MGLLNQGANYCKTPTDYVRALDVPLLCVDRFAHQMVTNINNEVTIIRLDWQHGIDSVLVSLCHKGKTIRHNIDTATSATKVAGDFLIFLDRQIKAIEQA